ncbi:MAG: DUF3795 domain-containing protein [Candidatus Nezhaarchaeota archaeon]|nr:DUF3795 domain-containing protein [Candidatus Nezhaarchaeota archaeon]MCX8141827.1 DUF3795 domain-containing protein [Candidatus Nezhaarchaeota archaeon]MDW8050392.1 DUF3795 domain-containing protein [Nitrososphaerota archaeon]
MPRINGVLHSYCGIVCSLCRAYVQDKCGGCDAHAATCKIAKCCLDRKLKCCFQCDDFPCTLHEEGFTWADEEFGILRWKVYSDVFLNLFRRRNT